MTTRTIGLIIVARDVTEHERLEEELRQSQKMDAVGRLAGGIAHDFNNLLTVVLGNLEMVRSGAAVGNDADEMLAATERAAKHAADLTKQMLGFARRQPLRTTTVDLNTLVRSDQPLRRTIDPRIVIRFNPAPDLRPVAADPVQIQQVLMNLCLNARDALPDGGMLMMETANVDEPVGEDAPPKPYVRLTVADTGVGMTDDVRAKVFDPFFTTKGVGKGTGLGLAVVYGAGEARTAAGSTSHRHRGRKPLRCVLAVQSADREGFRSDTRTSRRRTEDGQRRRRNGTGRG